MKTDSIDNEQWKERRAWCMGMCNVHMGMGMGMVSMNLKKHLWSRRSPHV